MKKLLLYLFLLPALVFGQISKKQMFFQLAGGSSTPSDEVININFDVDIIQYSDEPIVLSATPVAAPGILSYAWTITDSNGDLHGLSFDQNATITTVTEVREDYIITFTAKTATDQFIQRWTEIVVDYPRFTEGEADIVINQASGNYYNNFAEADNSGLKIFVKGSGTAQIQFVGLFGTEGDPVRVQKSDDNTDITLTCPAATPHAIYLYGNNEWIRFNGFNNDKTIGWNVIGDSGGAQVIAAKDGAFTGIQFLGISTTHSTSVNAASFSFIPNTNATYNASTYVGSKLMVWGCSITNAGEEAIYMGYNSDVLISTYRPIKFYDCIISWNDINGAGRDGIQPGGCEVIISNNTIRNWGLQHDTSHESAASLNGGSYGVYHSNYSRGGEMWLNIQSGVVPYNLDLGETAARGWEIYGNDHADSVYTAGGSTEIFDVYVQNSGFETTATTNWPVNIYNNTVKTDKKFMEAYFHANSWTWTNHKSVNNVIVKVGSAGDTDEANYTGPGTQPTGTTQNNLIRDDGSESDILFTDYDNYNLTISSLSSPVYTGATDVSSYVGDYDYLGQPLNTGAFAHGAYSGYAKKIITPTVGDADPATFSVALAMGTLTQSGGTITYEANKLGILYWAITTNGGTAPTEAQLRAGGFGVASGAILDGGTAGSYVVSTLTEGTAYDLHGIFVTVDNVPQASVTKVDFTTSADVVAPTVSSMTIADANRDKIVIVFTEAVTGTNAGFTIAGTTSTSFSSISGTGTNTITGTLAVAATYGQSVTLAYSSGTGDLRDLATSPNDLATFGATAVTNNIAAEAAEPVVANLNSNITVSGTNSNDFTSTSTSAYVTSTQIIPSTSNGYIEFDWDQDTRNASAIRIGFIDSADGSPAAGDVKLWLALSAGNHNIDIYEGGTYKSTYGTFGYNQAGTKYRISIDRATQKITAKASSNNWSSSVTLYTSTTNFTGDFRYVFHTTVNGAQAMNNYIQADTGLN